MKRFEHPVHHPVSVVEASRRAITIALAASLAFAGTASAFDWTASREDSTVEIITLDEDGGKRETKIWIVVLDDAGYIRTNDSRWLANIRRGSAVQLRTKGGTKSETEGGTGSVETSVAVEIIDDDPTTYDQVEQAFKDKYGVPQKIMSAFRMSRPTVMRITPGTE
jgi:hypothetical protein